LLVARRRDSAALTDPPREPVVERERYYD
jgi:hypothetical protein